MPIPETLISFGNLSWITTENGGLKIIDSENMMKPFLSKLELINNFDYKRPENSQSEMLALELKHGHHYTTEARSIIVSDTISLQRTGIMLGTVIQKFLFTKASKRSIF